MNLYVHTLIMSDKTFLTICKVVGILFIIFGAFSAFGAVAVLLGAGALGVASSVAQQAGKDVPQVAYGVIWMAGLLTVVMAVLYFVAALGLLKLKSWAYIVVGLLGVVGILSAVLTGGFNIIGVGWGALYLVFAYMIMSKKNLFKN
jgi:hypothetical protein